MNSKTFITSIMSTGINDDGKFIGKFQWGLKGTRLSLVKVGSAEYQKITSKEPVQAIVKAKLIPGGVYIGKRGQSRIFIGEVQAEKTDTAVSNKLLWFLLDDSIETPAELQFNKIMRSDKNINVLRVSRYNYKFFHGGGRNAYPAKDDIRDLSAIDRFHLTVTNSCVRKLSSIAVASTIIEAVQNRCVQLLRINIDSEKKRKRGRVGRGRSFNSLTRKQKRGRGAGSRIVGSQRSNASNIDLATIDYDKFLLTYYHEKCFMRAMGADRPDVIEYTEEYKLLEQLL